MITEFDKVTIDDAKIIFQNIGFGISPKILQSTNEDIKSILKLGASSLICPSEDEYEPNELYHDIKYTGFDQKMLTSYVISRDDAKISAVICIINFAVSMLAYEDFKSYVISCTECLLGTYLPIIKKLNSQEKCTFFRIYYLYEVSNKKQGALKEEIEKVFSAEQNTQFCFISDQINCDKRNPENTSLCGENFNVSSAIDNLLKKNVVSEIEGRIIPNAIFI